MKYEVNIDLTDFAKHIGTYESDDNICEFIEALLKEVKGTQVFDKICNFVQQSSNK